MSEHTPGPRRFEKDEPGVKWAPEEVANGNKGIRWVSDEGVHGRPTDHDCRVYLESNPNARGCHCPECTMLAAAPQPEPDVAPLVEALQAISRNELDAQRAQHVAAVALAAYRKQGGKE